MLFESWKVTGNLLKNGRLLEMWKITGNLKDYWKNGRLVENLEGYWKYEK